MGDQECVLVRALCGSRILKRVVAFRRTITVRYSRERSIILLFDFAMSTTSIQLNVGSRSERTKTDGREEESGQIRL